MYAIFGATGQVGGAALDALLGQVPAGSLRLIGRRKPSGIPDGVDWRHADLRGDAARLADALAGVTAAFVLSPVAADADDVRADGDLLARNLATAVTAAGCPRIVALSSQGAHLDSGTGIIGTLHALESHLVATGARTTFLRPTFFMQSWLPFAQLAAATGRWHAMHAPAEAPMEAVSACDVGRCAARFLCEPEAPAVVNIRGAGAWSELDAARITERLSGRKIEATAVPPARRAGVLREAGIGRSYAEATADMYAAIEAGAVPFEPAALQVEGSESLETVFGRAFAS